MTNVEPKWDLQHQTTATTTCGGKRGERIEFHRPLIRTNDFYVRPREPFGGLPTPSSPPPPLHSPTNFC